jgi:hypothetical protein
MFDDVEDKVQLAAPIEERPTNIMTDSYWEAMAKAAGGLPIEARADIEEDIRDCQQNNGAEFNRVEEDTRAMLRKGHGHVGGLRRTVSQLQARRDFLHYNAKENVGESLALVLAQVETIDKWFESNQGRLAKRSRKNWHAASLNSCFIRLLETRSRHLHIDVPTQIKETSRSGRFHVFLELAAALIDIHANTEERADRVTKGVAEAVKTFQHRKADPIYSWEWDDLFPNTAADLRKSRRYRNV